MSKRYMIFTLLAALGLLILAFSFPTGHEDHASEPISWQMANDEVIHRSGIRNIERNSSGYQEGESDELRLDNSGVIIHK